MDDTNGIIIGNGEIGNSLGRVLGIKPFGRHDTTLLYDEPVSIMNICFPYTDDFVDRVKKYQAMYRPSFTVVHSTVPVGTNRSLGSVSSPVIGIHPHLDEGIRTFTKFLGGEKASEVADYFRRKGLKVYIFDKSETSELMKILDTTFYGVCIEYTKDVKRQADKFGVPFEAWSIWTSNYNESYQKLGHPEFTRPNLTPILKPLGGHCVLPNAKMIDTKFTKLINESNEQ